MKDFAHEPNKSTPGIFFDKNSGELLIVGESFPEDANGFFEPVCNWIDEYVKKPSQRTVLDFVLSYYNSISALFFLGIMRKIEELKVLGYNATIRWFYNYGDVDLLEAGEEFESLLDVDFEMVIVGDDNKETIEENKIDKLIDDLF